MCDPIIRNWFNTLSAGVTANGVLAELGVDQRGELSSALYRLAIYLTEALKLAPLARPSHERLWHRINVDLFAAHHDDRC